MREETVAFSVLLIAASLTAAPSVPTSISYILLSASYVFVFFYLVSGRLPVYYYRPVLYPVVLIGVMFVVSFLFNFERSSFLRLLSFTLLTGFNILVLSTILTRKTALKAIARVSAVLVVIALPVMLFGAYSLGPIRVRAWATPYLLGPFVVNVTASIFVSPTLFAAVVVLGTIAAGAELVRDRSAVAAGLFVINALGIVAAHSRTGWIAITAAAGLYLAYQVAGERGLTTASIGGLGIFIVFVLGMAGVFSIPVVSDISLTGRADLWRATIKAVAERPLVGWGLGNDAAVLKQWLSPSSFIYGSDTHNSYLRLFLIGGVIAGVSYLVLCITSLAASLKAVHKSATPLRGNARPETVFSVMLLVAFFIITTFGSATIYGIGPFSTIGSVVVGLSQPRSAIRAIDLSPVQRRLPEKWSPLTSS